MAALLRLFVYFISLLTQILLKLRLGIPLLYTILMMTAFSEWAAAHNTLSIGILIAMVVAVAASWGITLVRKVRSAI